MVDRLSGGKVGYIYLSDFAELGSEDFIRQFDARGAAQGHDPAGAPSN